MTLAPATPELPVADVPAAQAYYRDKLGFTISWHNEPGRIGAVSHGECAIFLRTTDGPIHPAVVWMFTSEVDAAFADLSARGAAVIDPIADKPWGLRQFSIADLHGHVFHFHCDLDG